MVGADLRERHLADHPDVRPALFPIGIEWPDVFILRHELSIEIEVDGALAPFFDTQLELESPSETGPLRFSVTVENRSASYDIVLSPDDVTFTPVAGRRAFVHFQRRGRVPIEQVFMREAPIVRFANAAWLEGNRLFPPSPTLMEPFKRDRIEVWDWTGIDLAQESQGAAKASTSADKRKKASLGGPISSAC